MSIALSRQVSLPKPTGPPVAQFLAAGTFVVDPLPNSKHFLIPVIRKCSDRPASPAGLRCIELAALAPGVPTSTQGGESALFAGGRDGRRCPWSRLEKIRPRLFPCVAGLFS